MTLERLVPMQPVSDLSASIAFYARLGFEVEQVRDDWGWARLRCGDCLLMLDRSIHRHGGAPRLPVLYLYPDDVRAFHRRALANGLDLPPPETTFYGMLEFRIEDPDGNRLWIGQALADEGAAADAQGGR